MDGTHDASERRVNYDRDTLDESQAARDPFAQFAQWFEAALVEPGLVEPYGMALATCGPDDRPSSRIVLLRGHDERGFTFYTNYDGRKGRELAHNAAAALLFWWGSMQRQIRIEGFVAKIDPAESDAYFARRPRGHRLSAWASDQSTTVPDRAYLEGRMAAADARFAGDVPRPEYWGGFRLVPDYFEFWQGRKSRVHDRLAYARDAHAWTMRRLSP